MIQVRVDDAERKEFQWCAKFSGLGVSTWIRTRMVATAIAELEARGIRSQFAPDVPEENYIKDDPEPILEADQVPVRRGKVLPPAVESWVPHVTD